MSYGFSAFTMILNAAILVTPTSRTNHSTIANELALYLSCLLLSVVTKFMTSDLPPFILHVPMHCHCPSYRPTVSTSQRYVYNSVQLLYEINKILIWIH